VAFWFKLNKTILEESKASVAQNLSSVLCLYLIPRIFQGKQFSLNNKNKQTKKKTNKQKKQQRRRTPHKLFTTHTVRYLYRCQKGLQA